MDPTHKRNQGGKAKSQDRKERNFTGSIIHISEKQNEEHGVYSKSDYSHSPLSTEGGGVRTKQQSSGEGW